MPYEYALCPLLVSWCEENKKKDKEKDKKEKK